MSKVAASDNHSEWAHLPDIPMLKVFKYLNVFQMKQIRLINKRWNEMSQNQFEKEAQLVLDNCIIHPSCPPWSIFKQSKLNFKSIKLLQMYVKNYEDKVFWTQIGKNVEHFNFDIFYHDELTNFFNEPFKDKELLLCFPKLKSIECSWSAIFYLILPQTLEEIKTNYVPKYLGIKTVNQYHKFQEIQSRMKSLRSITSNSLESIIIKATDAHKTDEQLGIKRFINVPLDDEQTVEFHPFNILETKTLDCSYIRGIQLLNRYIFFVDRFVNLEKLYLKVKPNGCFFYHDSVVLNKVKYIHLRTSEDLTYYEEETEEDESEDGGDDDDHYDEDESKDVPENLVPLPSEPQMSDESDMENDEQSEEDEDSYYAYTDLDDTNDRLKVSLDSSNVDSDVSIAPEYCQECVQNLVSCCPNIKEIEFANLFSDYNEIVQHFSKNLTKFILRGHNFTLNNFKFEYSNLEELTLHYKDPFRHPFEINAQNFVHMPILKKISLKLHKLSMQSLKVIMKKCPNVEVAEFKELTVEQILAIEEKWPNLKELHFDNKHFGVEELINGLKGNFTSLHTMIWSYSTCNGDETKYVGLFEKIPTLRVTYHIDYHDYCKLKYFQG